MRRATCLRPPGKHGRRRNIIRGHWRRTLAALVPIAIGLLVAAGIGTARESGHAQGADKPKPRHSNDPPKAIKHDESPALRSLNSKPPKGRNDHQERKIPVPPGSNGPDPVQQSSLVETSSPTAGTNFDGVSAVDSLPPDRRGRP
jgi:hypothetical protein